MNFPDLVHLRQLQTELWKWPRSRAAVMVGAGFSLNAEPLPGVTSRFPTWRQLVRAMFDELYPVQPDASEEQLKAREERFNSGGALRIASEYEAAFDNRKLEQLIRQQNPDADHQPGKLHQLLLQLPWADVFTTNYDTLLERTEVPGRAYQPVTTTGELTTAATPRIIKLHGSFSSHTPLIISEEDYRSYPRLFAPFVNSVQQSLLENSFVLIGFSGDDPNFLEWTGWIRDQLGRNHAPIYLVGPLSLGNAQRSLLDRRGVTPIDLSPLFEGLQLPNGIHAASIEWFLNSLWAARPPRPEAWPVLERTPVAMPDRYPVVVDAGQLVPEKAVMSPNSQQRPSSDAIFKVLARWQFERLKYPGWVVASERKRSTIWDMTKYWIDLLLRSSGDWLAVDRILLFRELNWRFEVSMVPLFIGTIDPFQKAVDEIFEVLVKGQPLRPSHAFPLAANLSQSDFVDAWFNIAFGLLRDARESYNSIQWVALKEKIDKLAQQYQQYFDRNQYEAALWAMWNVDRVSAKKILSAWQPSTRSPLALLWKAGLLAELDEAGEARTILRSALAEIRRALRKQGQNIELLSLEGWCTYLILAVGRSAAITLDREEESEYWERWEELKAWECDPWPHQDYFDKALSVSPPQPVKAIQDVRGFDPGHISVSEHWSSNQIDAYLPGFACIRLYEQAGIPMRLRILNISGERLQNACRWIAPFIGFWSPALLIRAGKLEALTKGDFLTRTQVAAMDPGLANRLYFWCLEILERELAGLTGHIQMGTAQEALLEVLPEVISRLTFKVSDEGLRRTFPIALNYHHRPGIRSHIRLHEASDAWFMRLFHAAEGKLLLEWLPDLIKAPLFDDSVQTITYLAHVWPDPMRSFPSRRARMAIATHGELRAAIDDATDWLLSRARSEAGEGWRRAINRLISVFDIDLMTTEQQQQFGDLLWTQRDANGLPDRPGYLVSGLLHLPASANVDVQAVVKHHILSLTPHYFVNRTSEGKTVTTFGYFGPDLLQEAYYASKPVLQLADQANGTIDWTPDEAKQLYIKIRAWWDNDKQALDSSGGYPRGFAGINPISRILQRLGEFLACVVLPKMRWADEGEWQDFLMWLEEVRNAGTFPTLALPYVLLQRPKEAADIEAIIWEDIHSNVEGAVEAAAEAIRHWKYLSDADLTPVMPLRLIEVLIERVIFRQKVGISACLQELSFLISEKNDAITFEQASLLIASLGPWYESIRLPITEESEGEFLEEERPDLQVQVAGLAGVLSTWHRSVATGALELQPITLWRDACSQSVLPEVRRAFSAFEVLN